MAENEFFRTVFCGGLSRLSLAVLLRPFSPPSGGNAGFHAVWVLLTEHKVPRAPDPVRETPVFRGVTFYGTFPRTGNDRSHSRSWTSPFSGPFEALRRPEPPRPQLPQQLQWYPSLPKGNPTSLLPPYSIYTFTFALRVLLSLYGRNSRKRISATMAKAAMEPMMFP